jgi:hypothetical protein
MPQTILTKNLVARIDDCIQRAKLATNIEHNGLAGTIREMFVSQLIAPLLPDGFRVGKGKIIDRNGGLSPEIDILIYNRSRFSPLLFDEATGVFPVESVIYAIEVKTTVTATQIRDAVRKAESLGLLFGGRQVRFVLFGFSSDVTTSKADLDRIQAFQSERPQPRVGIYCCVGMGYCYHDLTKWVVNSRTDGRAEVVGLLIGIMNSLVSDGFRPTTDLPGMYLAWWERTPG